ncbi:ATP-dependent RNA helicase DEAH13 [Prunus yedoensis var. nudiflora]|uniref:RNA helicase n=1 Tax=Prunus yedoensis var. nudiflora TaxID=2094558 RepID=A0A314UCR0_PRUYE|nr:ATP-dependent RNA helicase DEAH13 [Prunus yedoensis var. nudiflora]
MSKSQKRKRNKLEVESKDAKRRKALQFPKAGFNKNNGDCACSDQTEPDHQIEKTQSKQDLDEIHEDKVKESPKVNSSSRASELSEFPAARPPIAPTIVHVSRPDEVEEARKDLPIVMMEQEIMEAINENSTVIIRGETGCGKTTQVPQFLFEAGYGSSHSNAARSGIIGVTQPRRVAVYATAERVAYELGLNLGKEVGFQVRHDKRMSKSSCSIKFMTDGILLQELKSDFLLKQYSVIILDEVHVRSSNTDILIGMLSRVIVQRQKEYENQQKAVLLGKNISREQQIFPLKLVLMSATLREDFIRKLFVLKIHKRLPHGGILVFVTGKREVERLCQKLQGASRELMKRSVESDADEVSDIDSVEDELEGYSYDSETESEREFFHDDDRDSLCQDTPRLVDGNVAEAECRSSTYRIEKVKEGERLVVVATNVAETSLTISGIKYVVDTGKEKVKDYNSNGMETYKIQWISKASADQRKGRAGRTGPGHCYRLYSQAVYYNKFPDFSAPEISKVPFDGVALLLKSMNILKISNFPFPTPPEAGAVDEAERLLTALEASDTNGRLTPLGHSMACYPLRPRHSRMLLTIFQIMSKQKNRARANLVLAYAVAAVASLSCSNPFLRQFEDIHTTNHDNVCSDAPLEHSNQEKLTKKKLKETLKVPRERFFNPSSDALSRAYALQCYEISKRPVEFCNDNALHPKTMEEISKLRKQLLERVFEQSGVSGGEKEFSWIYGSMEDVERDWRVSYDKNPLSLYEEELLGQAICAGWADRVAKRIRGRSSSVSSDLGDRKVRAVRYQACMVKETVFLDPWSSVSNSAPEFLVYNELIQTRSGPYMYGVTRIKSEWLVEHARALCTFSAPPTDTKPYYEPLTDQIFLSRSSESFCLCFASRPAGGSWSTRVGNLLEKLMRNKIHNCAALRQVWKENRMELHPEFLAWFNKSFQTSSFEALWSLMLREVALE